MVRDNFAVFILSHGRANKVATVKTLKNAGYSGKWYILLDNEDTQIDEYKNLYGEEHIIIFDKKDAPKYFDFDIMDNFDGNKVITYARNALNKIALDMKLEYFWELEDDYFRFDIRMEINNHLPIIHVKNLDEVIEIYLNFLENIFPNIHCSLYSKLNTTLKKYLYFVSVNNSFPSKLSIISE